MTEPEFHQRLDDEISVWRRSHLITQDQAIAIRALYGTPDLRPRRGLAQILTLLGALCIGIGMIAVVAANWAFVPGPAKLGLLVAAMVASYHVGFRLRYGGGAYRGTGDALIFLGTWLYGGTIFLVAQGFHVNADAPSLLTLWSVGVLPLAYLLRSRAHLVLALIPLGIALGAEAALWLGDIDRAGTAIGVFVVFGVLLHALGPLHTRSRSFGTLAQPYTALGLAVVLAALLPVTFDLPGGRADPLPTGAALRLGALIAAAVAALGIGAWQGRGDRTALWTAVGSAAVLAVAVALCFAPQLPAATAPIANALYLALLVGALALGFATRDRVPIQLGLFAFTILIGCRYVDLLWDWMPRELFLIGAGVLLLGGGTLLERTRRRLLGRLEDSPLTEERL